MLTVALGLYGRPVTEAETERARERWQGPFRAISAHKSGEGWPYIVVGAQNINVFGRLWDEETAMAAAAVLNNSK